MSRYQEVKDRSLHWRSAQNIMRIIGFDIHKAIEDELSYIQRNRKQAEQSYSRMMRLRSSDENEQRQWEDELKNKLDNETLELYENGIQNTIQKFKNTLSEHYGKLIGLNIKDNETSKKVVIQQIYSSIYELKEQFQRNVDDERYIFKKNKEPYINYLYTIQTKLLEIAEQLKTANPEIVNEYINEIISTNPEEVKIYLTELLQSQNSGLTEEDRDKYSSLYYNKILVPFVQENAGKNPSAARQEIENLTKPDSKILTERFKGYSKEFLPYLTETEYKFDFEDPESEQKARKEVGTFDPFTTAKAKIYIKVAEQYDRENNYKMADQTIKTLEDKLKEYIK
jgi:hypothetical protein